MVSSMVVPRSMCASVSTSESTCRDEEVPGGRLVWEPMNHSNPSTRSEHFLTFGVSFPLWLEPVRTRVTVHREGESSVPETPRPSTRPQKPLGKKGP